MMRRHVWSAAASAFIVALATATPVLADPPGRVARLNYLRGSVSFRPASLDDWGPATLNYPLTIGDHLWTDSDATAEMHIGSSIVRLAPFTAFAVLNLDDRAVQLRLSEGTADIVIRRLDYGEQFEVDTPVSAVALVQPGVYRIDVSEDGNDTRVTVRRGEAEMYADETEFRVFQGQTGRMWGETDARGEVYGAEPADGWERWCRTRDEREARSLSVQYVSQELVGYEDLDEHGVWSSVPEYGMVWRPRVVRAGWAPFRHGHWAWIEPWGWTWVDDAPWGFAPSHYGRWACLRGDWFWVPGAYVARPYYAPALVAFIGGDTWSVSIGFSGGLAVGWFPLGPRDVYYPAYRASYGYFRNVNITHVNIAQINVTNYDVRRATYAHRYTAGAMTAVPRDAFLSARSLGAVARPVSGHAVDRADVVGMAPAIAPRADSVLAQRNVRVSRRAQDALGRPVVARTTPPPAVASFHSRQPLLQANGGRPVDDASLGLRQGTSDGLPVRTLSRARARGNGGALPGAPAAGSGTSPGDGNRGNALSAGRPAAGDQQAPPTSRQARPRGEEPGARDTWSRAPRPSQAEPEQPTPQDRRPGADVALPRGGDTGSRDAWSRAPRRTQSEPVQATPQNRSPGADVARSRGGDGASRDIWSRAPRPSQGDSVQAPPPSQAPGADNARPRGGDGGSRGIGSRAPRQNQAEPAPAAPQTRPSGSDAARPRGGDRRDSAAPAPEGRPESPSASPNRGSGSGSSEARPRRGRGQG